MSDMTDEVLIQMVSELNGCLPKELGEDRGDAQFSLRSNGWSSAILFGDIYLWDDDNDERPWDDDGEDYAITVKDYIIQEYQKLVKLMNAVKFTGDGDE